MFLYPHLVPLIIILVSSILCLSSSLENQLLINYDKLHRLKPMEDSVILGNPEAKLGSLIKNDTESFDLPRLYKVGAPTSNCPKIVNVDDFGARGDGTDDSKAFKKAWKVACACACEDACVLVVPEQRIYHLKPVAFSGPCNSDLTMKIYGTIKASVHPKDYRKDPTHWLLFDNIQNFNVKGGGTINGNGRIWWKNSCKINKHLPCKDAPTAITFSDSKNLRVSGLRFKNSQQVHLSFQKCENVKAYNLRVYAPQKSPNTDGIHVTGTKNIQIMNSVIKTGDDCISIVSGSKNVKIMDITCGPGHGISIGSLGKGNSEAMVSDVFVNRAKISGTTNGVRIKTWQGGLGYAKNIKFQNIAMYNVSNPIIIDQNYCDQQTPCTEKNSAVQVQNVWYKNIIGTSASQVAINFNCSKSFPCNGIMLEDINLRRESDGNVEASCNNVGLTTMGMVSPPLLF